MSIEGIAWIRLVELVTKPGCGHSVSMMQHPVSEVMPVKWQTKAGLARDTNTIVHVIRQYWNKGAESDQKQLC